MGENTPTTQPTAKAFLEAAYEQLDYQTGSLIDSIDVSQVDTVDADQWLEKGNWLELGEKINAEKIFFVNNDPVIVFRAFDSPPDDVEIQAAFRQTWCMTRSQYLFLALPGELRVYGLGQSPIAHASDEDLAYKTIKNVGDVLAKLNDYHREKLEAGHLPDDKLFGKASEQADKRLIYDLKEVRKQLQEINDLDLRFVHALIGRSIFVRYLEDRKVLSPVYFEQVARNHQRDDWLTLLRQPTPRHLIQDEKWQGRRYYQVLQDKDFTYALFEQLAEDFNGDLFPKDADEKDAVTATHLSKLRQFLLGDTDPNQPTLWLWAYDFEIIPIEIISSIYEEFYKSEKDDTGTHYTPSVLVEFVLSQVLSPSYLAAHPKAQILDPACGSGIFLVEAYRRLVRHRIKQEGRPLNSIELREILRDQIRGIEVNQNATYVAAFSLYLALLHYQKPSDILAQIEVPHPDDKPLPHLIYNTSRVDKPNQYGVLFNCNAFALTKAEREHLQAELEANRRRTRLRRFLDNSEDLPIEANSVDVMVGNPPWGGTTKESLEKQWCEYFGWAIGYQELSQAFIARSLNLLTPEGESGLLVSMGIFLKHNPKSENNRMFRQQWLGKSTLKTVVSFIHTCTLFFKNSNAIFAAVHYQAKPAQVNHVVNYWSSKRTQVIENHLAVVLHLSDIKRVKQLDLLTHEHLWKLYWWGNHHDDHFINLLNLEQPLVNFIDRDANGKPITGRGFENLAKSDKAPKPSEWLTAYKSLPLEFFQRYGEIPFSELQEIPKFVRRRGDREVYSGWRLLVRRGIIQKDGANGRIQTRLDNAEFSFLNSIHGLKVAKLADWDRKLLLGILWSSLTRYYLFMTSGSWTIWHKEIHLGQLRQLPIRFTDNLELRNRIVAIVDTLRAWDAPGDVETIASLEHQLDEAIFDLYDLREAERDLVLDMCETGLEFFYRHNGSEAVKPLEPYPQARQGFITDLPQHRNKESGLQGYLYAFLDMWQSYLEPEGVFRWRVIRPDNNLMIAVVFTTQSKDDGLPSIQPDEVMWADLERITQTSPQLVNPRIYIDGLVRLVTDNEIIIIKRNERRLWTRSQGREDAEATFLQAMRLQQSQMELE